MADERLGRGLGALLPQEGFGSENNPEGEYILCDVERIRSNPYQPRTDMNEEALAELTASIKEKGILQPLVVTVDNDSDDLEEPGYILIAGERRLKASKRAGLTEVPVIVKDIADNQNRLELALIENIQRQDLNPLEEALAYRQLTEEFDLTQEEVAQKVGKERSTISNTLRLLNLPDYVKDDLAQGRLSMGHARLLLSVSDEDQLRAIRNKIIQEGLSVRKAEAMAKAAKRKAASRPRKRPASSKPIPASYCKTLTNDIVHRLGTKSRIIQNGQRGKIEIEYYSLDDLERIHDLLSQIKA